MKLAWDSSGSDPIYGEIDIKTCEKFGGDGRMIASIDDQAVIQKILAHVDDITNSAATKCLPDCRA